MLLVFVCCIDRVWLSDFSFSAPGGLSAGWSSRVFLSASIKNTHTAAYPSPHPDHPAYTFQLYVRDANGDKVDITPSGFSDPLFREDFPAWLASSQSGVSVDGGMVWPGYYTGPMLPDDVHNLQDVPVSDLSHQNIHTLYIYSLLIIMLKTNSYS